VDYAVKKVLLTGSQHVQDRAVREAMCLAKLDHPNVVRYHQVWKEEVEESALEQFLDSSDEEDSSSLSLSRPTASRTHQSSSVRPSRSECGGALPARAVLYIQMQLCENTLREWMQTPGRDGSIGVNRGYFVQVLQGLAHIHQASLIHRDLTPNNVFITHDKTFKIGDFGLSREMTDADSLAAPLDPEHGAAQDALLQSVSRGVGTSLYMSPEQRGCCKVDYKADVYSAGVILLELCYPVRTWRPVPHVLARPHADPLLCSQMSTHMERVVVLSALQRRELPRSLAGTAVGLLILRLTADSAAARPTVAALLSDELLSG
jgi:serine/threonine protein kinase